MTFFLDNNLSVNLAKGMQAFGEDVIHLTERFRQDTPDVEWLKVIGEEDIVLITRDEKIRWKPAEWAAFRKYGVRAFFLGGKNRSSCDLIMQLVRNWPHIKDTVSKSEKKSPYAFRIPPSGTKFIPLSIQG